MKEAILRGVFNRCLQAIASIAPGGGSFRIWLHRLRGVQIGTNVFIGTQAMIETAFPHLVTIGNHSVIGLRSIIIAHFDGDVFTNGVPTSPTVKIEEHVFIGPGAIIMPNVTIGTGSVVAAGSVVTTSIPPRHFVRGNPAKIIATCKEPLTLKTSTWRFLRGLVRTESGKD